jgi:[ribosomal protein S18]-alanine N-acetyltransferase
MGSPQLVAEFMQVSDLEEILAIEEASFAKPWTKEMYLKELSNRTSRPFVYRINTEIVGYMCFWVVLDEAHLMTIAVHPDRRGEGIGKAIMEHLEQVSLKEDLKKILLEVGRRNVVARGLYRQSGFTAVGFRKNYYANIKDDALLMEKWLTSNRRHPASAAHRNNQ